MGKIARIDEMLKGFESDKRERLAMALYWVDRWGLSINECQTGDRVKWWLTQVDDNDTMISDDPDEGCSERGRNHFRLLADVAMEIVK